MKIKLLLSLISPLVVFFSSLSNNGTSFRYQYQIKANSFSPKDSIDLYYYKEKLIDKYEEIAFSISQDNLLFILENSISEFKFDDKCYPSLKNGTIILTIGYGKGGIIKGNLRYNICDEEVIREKIYLLDIFK